MTCKKCGTEVQDKAKFCPRCGLSLAEQQNVAPSPAVQAQAQAQAQAPAQAQRASTDNEPPARSSEAVFDATAISPRPASGKMLALYIIALGLHVLTNVLWFFDMLICSTEAGNESLSLFSFYNEISPIVGILLFGVALTSMSLTALPLLANTYSERKKLIFPKIWSILKIAALVTVWIILLIEKADLTEKLEMTVGMGEDVYAGLSVIGFIYLAGMVLLTVMLFIITHSAPKKIKVR